MSCYICSDKTFASVANELKVLIYGSTAASSVIKYSLDIPHDANMDESDRMIDEFILGIYEENINAVNTRYDETNEPDPLDLDHFQRLGTLSLIKQLHHIRYQCDEDQEKSKWFEYLGKLITNLGSLYISNLPEYQKAPWGID